MRRNHRRLVVANNACALLSNPSVIPTVVLSHGGVTVAPALIEAFTTPGQKPFPALHSPPTMKEQAVAKLEAFVVANKDFLVEASVHLIRTIPDEWLPPDDAPALLLLDLRDPFAKEVREQAGLRECASPTATASLLAGIRDRVEVVVRAFRSERLGEPGDFPGWPATDIPLVVISSGAVAIIPFGVPQN